MKHRACFSAEQRQEILDKLQQSDLSLTEFARQNGLSRVLLSVWLKRYVRQSVSFPAHNCSAAQLAEVPLKEIGLAQVLGQPPWAAELTLPGAITVRLDASGQAKLLEQLFKSLAP